MRTQVCCCHLKVGTANVHCFENDALRGENIEGILEEHLMIMTFGIDEEERDHLSDAAAAMRSLI